MGPGFLARVRSGLWDMQMVKVLPGQILKELRENDRVIGGLDKVGASMGAELFAQISTGQCHVTDAATAEMTKLAENAYRDVNIAFANELAAIAEAQNIDPRTVIALANRHPRVDILDPGPGVGGHCIAVDPWFIVSSAPDDSQLIRAAREVNSKKPLWVLDKINEALGRHLAQHPEKAAANVQIALYGLAFKPDIDDLRESPALDIAINVYAHHPGKLLVVEPNIDALPTALENAQLIRLEQTSHADSHVMLVDHREFKGSERPQGELVDARGVWTSPPKIFNFYDRRNSG